MTLDIVLPGQDGVSLIHELRAHEETRDLPIVIVALDSGSDRSHLVGDAVGIIDWLSKPVDPIRLLHAIARAARRRPGSVPRILHVEDDADAVTLLAALVGKRAEMVAARSCREAQRALSEAEFDLIVLDVELPDGSGLDLLPLLHRSRPVPVLVFSAHELSLAMGSDIEAALTKSQTSNEEILRTIESLIDLAEPVAS
jgi:DNA-binding response OmpR family regulator